MTDLVEAGRRLAATRLGPNPPVAAIEARRAHRRRHRRWLAGGTILVLVAATVAIISAVLPGRSSRSQRVTTAPTAPTTSAPSPTGAAPSAAAVGSVPYDYLRLRVWVPPGWSTQINACGGDQTDIVDFPTLSVQGQLVQCPNTVTSSTLVVDTFTGTIPPSATRLTVNGLVVWSRTDSAPTVWLIPALQVELSFRGPAAENVARTIQPSPLQHILTDTFPTSIPADWKTITYDGFQAQVPPAWPIHRIITTPTEIFGPTPPNICAPPLFSQPSVYFGGPVVDACIAAPTATTAPPPNDGLWLYPSTDRATPLSASSALAQHQGVPQPPGPQRLLTIGSWQALVMSDPTDDDVYVEIADGDHRIHATIGPRTKPRRRRSDTELHTNSRQRMNPGAYNNNGVTTSGRLG